MKRIIIVALAVFCLSSLHSVAPGATRDENLVLKERVKAFWDAQVKDDWSTLYDFLRDPGKETDGKEAFAAKQKDKNPLTFLSYSIGRVETDGDVGWVEMEYIAGARKFPKAPPRQVMVWQVWQKREQNWYPLPRERLGEVPKMPPSLRPAEEEAALTGRVDEFWDAKEKGRWDIVYEYCDPTFKGRMPAQEFLQRKALRSYLSHSIDWAEVSGDQGKVKITYSYKATDPSLAKLDPEEDSLVEEWVKAGGVWYRLIPAQD